MSQKSKRTGCLQRIAAAAGIAAAIILALILGVAINQRVALHRAMARYPPPGRLVEVGGHSLHFYCVGSGSPTVVIDAGNGSLGLEWTPIQEQLQGEARVCTVDRAGYGWSEPGPLPRDGERVVTELHNALATAGETGPYLLVGHSLGGAHVRIWAARYPDEVAGLVLVDAPAGEALSPELETNMRSSIGFYQVMRLLTGSGLLRLLGPLGGEDAMPETARKLPPALRDPYLELILNPAHQTAAIAEMQALPVTLRQAGEGMVAGALGDRPLIVLTAGQRSAPGSNPFAPSLAPQDAAVIEAQGALAALSSRGEQRVLPESGHYVHLDAPQAVTTAVRDALAACRKEN